jgi:hypothetical protein
MIDIDKGGDDLLEEELADAYIAGGKSRTRTRIPKKISSIFDPISYQEAMNQTDSEKWKHAITEEWQALLDNGTFDFGKEDHSTDEPMPERPPISSKWVLKIKRNPNGSLRYKARLVIRGFLQREGLDYGETYAPVSKLTTFRYVLALASTLGWDVDHMDVMSAFLNPEIDKNDVYMTLPEMEATGSTRKTGSTVRLLKALYGLKQAPRLWWKDINNFLLSIGFVQSNMDPNLYLRKGILLLLYVDDILIAHQGGDASPANEVKSLLMNKYKMSDLGPVRRFLGIEVTRQDGRYEISQTEYIQTILERFEMEDAYEVSTPMDPNVDLNNLNCEDKAVDSKHYLSIVGSLMYAALGTRPDIAFAVTALSRHNASPLVMHLTAAKRVLRYLKRTKTITIKYNGSEKDIHGYTDSDWAGNKETRKSIGGCIFLLGGPIHWQAKTQSVVALSTLEAEFIACSDATREAIWLRCLNSETVHFTWNHGLDLGLRSPTHIKCDNQGALKLIETGIRKHKTKHIAIKYFHTIDEQEKGTVQFSYVESSKNLADMLTKPLHVATHARLINLLGLNCFERQL